MSNSSPGRNALCPCGSGKKFKRCCGLSSPPREKSDRGMAQALAHLQNGELSLAEILLVDLVNAKPRDATARYLLGYAALQSGRHAEAVVSMRHAIELGLADPAAFYHLGCALSFLGHFQDAAAAFKQALTLKPDLVAAVTHLANCKFELQEFAEAERLYRQTLAREPDNFVANHNLGQVFYLTQRIAEAIAYFEHAADAAPTVAEFRASLATMQEADNQLDAAEASARIALSSDPHNTSASIALARVLRRKDRPDEALAVLDTADLQASLTWSQIGFWSERGQALEKLGRFSEAFEAYAHSKTRLAETRAPYDGGARTRHLMAREREVVTPGRVANWTVPFTPAQPMPVFIVGFPRSGTTLLEQMLGCHPSIVACGELQTVLENPESSDFLDALDALDDDTRLNTVAALRQKYLAVLHGGAKPDGAVRYATDKLPLNMMRIGLIRLLFPEAKIIHVLRHPLDAVLSAYFTPFLFGNEWSMRLLDTAQMFVQTWHHVEAMKTLPGLRFTRVRYEDLVTAPERALRQILEFLDLPWSAACLDFHKSTRVARTASYAQVTRTLYQTSNRRYRNFIDCLDEDVLEAIRPVVAAAGYVLE
ncbi:MAG: sulfotransferase [Thiobacillus sp.]|nr:sulfotransferase [Thiobacillus sp.]